MTRFPVTHVIIKNTMLNIVKKKPWFAQKIAAVLGEIFVPEYPQVPANIPATTPSYQVKIIEEQDVM